MKAIITICPGDTGVRDIAKNKIIITNLSNESAKRGMDKEYVSVLK
jgi:hypothetical protein